MASKISTAARDRRAGDFPWEGIGRVASRTVLPGLAAVAAAGLLAACGSAGAHATGGGKAHPPGSHHRVVVSARTLPGVGTVLVNRSGKTLYSPQQEAHGKILCTGSCLSFWFPVPAGAGAVQAPSGVTGALGTIRRPDGRTRLAAAGPSNRQIAEQAFISTKTVEANLSRAYVKPGIRSRTQLVHVMAAHDPPPS